MSQLKLLRIEIVIKTLITIPSLLLLLKRASAESMSTMWHVLKSYWVSLETFDKIGTKVWTYRSQSVLVLVSRPSVISRRLRAL